MAFLDTTGLEYFWQKIVAKLSTKADVSSISTLQSEIDALESGKANIIITASASDDDVVVLTGNDGENGVSYSASHANSGVAAGTYKSVTVNAKGHVTGGSNPTTISGYGITDAYSKFDIDNKVAELDFAIQGKETSGAATGAVSTHNTSDSAHNDIRLLIDGLNTRLNALANSTDEDLDQMAEIVDYIKSNKSLIDDVTTKKVNTADIIDNLTTNVSNRPLSSAQGVVIKSQLDALEEAIGNVSGGAPVFTDDGDGNVILSNASVDDALEAIENGSY